MYNDKGLYIVREDIAMKLTEMLINQKIILQFLWGEQKIEVYSEVLESDGIAAYVSPYVHNGSVIEMNITQGSNVVCNVFTDNPNNMQRISWKNIELTTVKRGGRPVYCLRTYGFNAVATHDDRRLHERIAIDVNGRVFDGDGEDGVSVVVHDISDVGISFYAPNFYVPKSGQQVILFTDTIDEKIFEVRVECSVFRSNPNKDNVLIGCKIVGENKDYKLYGLLKRLKEKNKSRQKSSEENIVTE